MLNLDKVPLAHIEREDCRARVPGWPHVDAAAADFLVCGLRQILSSKTPS
jgi:hypothetical protein